MNKIDSYLEIIHEKDELIKDIGIDVKKLDKSLVRKVSSAMDENDPKGSINKIKRLVPPGFKNTLPKAENFANKHFDKFSPFKMTSKQILKNSIPGISPKMLDAASTFLAISAMLGKKSDKNKKPEEILKLNIKEFVDRVRKFGEDYDDEDDTPSKSKLRTSDWTDIAVAFVIIVMASALALGVGTGLIVLLSAVAGVITTWAPVAIVVWLLMMIVFGILGVVKG